MGGELSARARDVLVVASLQRRRPATDYSEAERINPKSAYVEVTRASVHVCGTGASHFHVLTEALELLPGAQLVADRVTLVRSGAVNMSGKVAATSIPQCAVAQRRELCRDITGSREALPVLRPTPWGATTLRRGPAQALLSRRHVVPGDADSGDGQDIKRVGASAAAGACIIRVVRSCRRGRRRRRRRPRARPRLVTILH